MTAELRRSIFLACVGLLGGFALVVTLYGASTLFKHGPGSSAIQSLAGVFGGVQRPATEAPPTLPGKSPATRTEPAGGTEATAKADPAKADSAKTDSAKTDLTKTDLPKTDLPKADPPKAGSAPAQDGARSESPTFDIIRVEPTGETVIAGRAPPNTTVELLRDNQPIARALVDPSGQFAIVPPALPAGNSEITLRGTGADGQARTSRESVVVVVAQARDTKPLIALTAPDRPTVVLSQPDPAGAAPGQAVAAADPRPSDARPAGAQDMIKPEAGQAPGKAPGPVKIVSVEAEEGGRLYVTSQAPPGATVRLYLNDALVAPGSVGADGRVAFAIGRGIQPGAYKVRVDQVDPVSGKVKTRSEVAFTVPPAAKPVAAATKPAEPAAEAGSPDRRVAEAQATPAASPQPTVSATASTGAVRPGSVFVPELGTARITRGDSLWQISRRIYGKGTRYTVIFDANQPQIRNPDRIYPGQIFVLPNEGSAAGAQAPTRG